MFNFIELKYFFIAVLCYICIGLPDKYRKFYATVVISLPESSKIKQPAGIQSPRALNGKLIGSS